ncbi:MAG TPA: hypothetical protein PLC27_15020 [Saprospiraceae bacterium]|nr:hypothetical protein [Saprospiraceae bacterium]HRG42719.1 hypothetical protein [Saprospiraceae bacterium]
MSKVKERTPAPTRSCSGQGCESVLGLTKILYSWFSEIKLSMANTSPS